MVPNIKYEYYKVFHNMSSSPNHTGGIGDPFLLKVINVKQIHSGLK